MRKTGLRVLKGEPCLGQGTFGILAGTPLARQLIAGGIEHGAALIAGLVVAALMARAMRLSGAVRLAIPPGILDHDIAILDESRALELVHRRRSAALQSRRPAAGLGLAALAERIAVASGIMLLGVVPGRGATHSASQTGERLADALFGQRGLGLIVRVGRPAQD